MGRRSLGNSPDKAVGRRYYDDRVAAGRSGGGRGQEEGDRGKETGGRRKEEGGRRKEERGRRKERYHRYNGN